MNFPFGCSSKVTFNGTSLLSSGFANCKKEKDFYFLETEATSFFGSLVSCLVAKYVYVRTHIDCFLVDGKSVERHPIKNRKGERPSLEISLRGP